jgi:hypothetical protein
MVLLIGSLGRHLVYPQQTAIGNGEGPSTSVLAAAPQERRLACFGISGKTGTFNSHSIGIERRAGAADIVASYCKP